MNQSAVIDGSIKIMVKKLLVEGRGAIILTGPSSCGKGEVAKGLRRFLSIPIERHLSMGDILRLTIEKARKDEQFRIKLAATYGISNELSVFDGENDYEGMYFKAKKNEKELKEYFGDKELISQLDWLEFCTVNGLLVPDSWTIKIINAMFEDTEELRNEIFILDGYPRTVKAATELINTFVNFEVPVIKVIHLSITKDEMIKRALGRQREDDNIESLERRFQFYIENVQPSIDYLKYRLGSNKVALIDAHQPVLNEGSELDINRSIELVTLNVISSLGLPSYLLNL